MKNGHVFDVVPSNRCTRSAGPAPGQHDCAECPHGDYDQRQRARDATHGRAGTRKSHRDDRACQSEARDVDNA